MMTLTNQYCWQWWLLGDCRCIVHWQSLFTSYWRKSTSKINLWYVNRQTKSWFYLWKWFMMACSTSFLTIVRKTYSRSLNISLHQIISDFTIAKIKVQLLNYNKIRGLCANSYKHKSELSSLFRELPPPSPNLKCAKRQLQSNSWKIKCAKR